MEACRTEMLRLLPEQAVAKRVREAKKKKIRSIVDVSEDDPSPSLPLSAQAQAVLEEVISFVSQPSFKTDGFLPSSAISVERPKAWFDTPEFAFSAAIPEAERDLSFFGISSQYKEVSLSRRDAEHVESLSRHLTLMSSFMELGSQVIVYACKRTEPLVLWQPQRKESRLE